MNYKVSPYGQQWYCTLYSYLYLIEKKEGKDKNSKDS